jgi:hypothetical protein
VAQSSQLPRMAEISVVMAPEDPGAPPAGPYVRRVVLPMPPIDLVARLGGDETQTAESSDQGDDEGCLRVRDCIDAAALALDPLLSNIVNDPNIQDQCLADTGIPDEVLLEACRK